MTRTRLPVFSVQGDLSEYELDEDEEFEEHSDDHLGYDDGPLAIRLEVESEGLVVAVTRTLVWSQSVVSHLAPYPLHCLLICSGQRGTGERYANRLGLHSFGSG
jgi:hypothetical protein